MKHTIKLLAVTAFAVITMGVSAQTIFFPTKTGTVLTFAEKDQHGKITGYTRQTIKTVEGSGENMTISYQYESLDEHKNLIVALPCKMVIKDNVMIFDLKHVFVGKLENSKEKIEVTGTPMQFPNTLMPGQSLKDAHLVANVERGLVHVNVDVKMTAGKCTAIENVTVPAGTFNAHKISQSIATTMMGSTKQSHAVSWGAPDVGIVKINTYDTDNQLLNSVVLVEKK